MKKTIGATLILIGMVVFLNSCSTTPKTLINPDLSNFTCKPDA